MVLQPTWNLLNKNKNKGRNPCSDPGLQKYPRCYPILIINYFHFKVNIFLMKKRFNKNLLYYIPFQSKICSQLLGNPIYLYISSILTLCKLLFINFVSFLILLNKDLKFFLSKRILRHKMTENKSVFP